MGENIQPNKNVPTVAKEIRPDIQNLLEPNALALAIVGTHIPVRLAPEIKTQVSIGMQEELDLEEVLSSVDSSSYDKLLLVVHSPGGNVRSSYKVAKRIRKEFSEIKAFVPHLALSGGTLIALTGNEIVMGEMSNLTPIDVQMEYKGNMVSVNAMLRAVEGLGGVFRKHSKGEIPYPWVSLADKLDPVIYQEWLDTSILMKNYAIEILSHDNAEFSEEEAVKIVNHLMERLPTHSYALMRDELNDSIKNLTDKQDFVKSPSEYPDLWPHLVDWQRKYTEVEATSHTFRFVKPAEEERGGENEENEK